MNSQTSSVSVTLPNYNHAKLLPRALDALLSQSLKPAEIIIVDDASTDESLTVIEWYAANHPEIIVLRNERNLGPIPSVNRALKCATGTFLSFQSADDFVLPDFNRNAVAAMEKFPLAAQCMCDPATFTDEDATPRAIPQHLATEPSYFPPEEYLALQRKHPFNLWGHSSLFRRSAVLAAGGFRPELRWHADWFLYQVLALRHGLCYVPNVSAALRVASDSYSMAGIRNRSGQHEVVLHMVEIAKSPQFRDVWPLLRRSIILETVFPTSFFEAMLMNPRHINALTARGAMKLARIFLGSCYRTFFPRAQKA